MGTPAAPAALKGEKTLAELAQQYDVHANQITQCRSQLLEGAADMFGSEARPEASAPAVDVKTLHAKIGQLTLKNDFLEGALTKAGLLSVKRLSTAITTYPFPGRRANLGSAAAAFTICHVRHPQMIWRSCAGSMRCIWIILLLAPACCVTCWLQKASGWAGCTSRRS